ncbi:hypothetical protein Q7P36_011418 [Cladosporium allicinum]
MSSTEIAGVVGTWIAVGLAVFALLGIVALLLVWRASNSARNQALAKLDQGLSTSHGFVTKGIRLGFNTYLFRRIRAPVLTETLELSPTWKSEYTETALPSERSAGWVQLGAVLRNHGLEYPTGDGLTLNDETMQLRISTVWLFTFGLIGRFGARIDTGEWIAGSIDGAVFEQPKPGRRLAKAVEYRRPRAGRRSYSDRPNMENDGTEHSYGMSTEWTDDARLHGLTGRMGYYREDMKSTVDFKAHTNDRIGGLSKEVLGVARLFWLYMGCLPMADGRIFRLEDVQCTAQELPNAVSHHIYLRDEEHHQRPRFREPRLWSFTENKTSLTDFVRVAAALGAEHETRKRSLTEILVSPDEVSALQEDAKRDFVPCHRNWVRLGPPVPEGSWFSGFFLSRADAQLLARVLLQLPLCSQGYLIHIPPGSACAYMLGEAYSLLSRLLCCLIDHFDDCKTRTRLDQLDDSFLPNLKKLSRLMGRRSSSRMFASVLYDLDCALVTTVSSEPDIHFLVQVLAITSPEFRDLVNQSLRDLEACLDRSITFDAAHVEFYTTATMGALKVFPMDLDVLLDDPRAFPRSGTTQIPYVDVLFLVLKACLRSAFLETSLDSKPLFDAVFKPGVDVFEVC